MLECLADTSRAWESRYADIQMILTDFGRPQSIAEEQGNTEKKS